MPGGPEWRVLRDGMIGEVKRAPLAEYYALADYRWPTDTHDRGWEQTAADIAVHRDKFIFGGWHASFERMQFLRGSEQLFADLADEDCTEVYTLRDRVFDHHRALIERWVRTEVDAVILADDWGSQRSLLISPAKWREFFKPKYREHIELIRDAGKRVFFHSDGYIVDIYPDLIEMGVNAINSQIWCMGLETLAPFAGQITFWGELDRQRLLPQGTPAEVRDAARRMWQAFYRNGGVIGQCEADHLAPLENIEAALSVWGGL